MSDMTMMRKIYFFLVLLLMLGVVCPDPSAASFISIEIEAGVELFQNSLRTSVKVTNKGDEPAENVKTSVEVQGKRTYGKARRVLGPNEQFTEEFTTPVIFEKPGRYPVLISVDYTDANQYPFNALTINYADYQESPNARVAGSVGTLNLSGSEKLKVSVKNTDEIERKVLVRLVTSKEFAVQNRLQEIAVSPGDEKKLSFDVKNTGGLPGSTYPVFALIIYEDTSYRYLSVASGNIVVMKKGIWHGLKLPLAILLAVLVSGICLFYLVKLKRSFFTKK
ncbi:MAG: hypothetical protein HQL08_03825 [Nitrospirae bacterium]|nr:hypothetical protein [Nitrospirota bacterium]